MRIETQGIVLSHKPVYDADAFVDILSDLYGKLSIHCKGVQKIASKNRIGLELLCLSQFEIDVNETNGKMKLVRATLIDGHIHLMDSFVQYGYACVVGQAFLLSFAENQPDATSFHVLLKTIHALNKNDRLYFHVAHAFFYLLKILGIEPQLSGCVVCGKTTKLIGFSVAKGGYLCIDCRFKGELAPLNLTQSKAILHVAKGKDIDVDEKVVDALISFYELHAHTRLSSYDVIKKLV